MLRCSLPFMPVIPMSRSHKEQHARQEREASRRFIDSFNEARGESRSLEAVRRFHRAQQEREEALRDSGPFEGYRYGNQRGMRAKADVKDRRADRHRHTDPEWDADGDLGLESRPASAAKRRGPKWA